MVKRKLKKVLVAGLLLMPLLFISVHSFTTANEVDFDAEDEFTEHNATENQKNNKEESSYISAVKLFLNTNPFKK